MISFIVPAYNEEALLGRTLASIHAAARGVGVEYELIVVNDGSTDRTPEIAVGHGAKVVSVRLRHIAAVRNVGARHAVGARLMFCDADTVLSSEALRGALLAFERGAVGGAARIWFEDPVPAFARVTSTLFLFGLYNLRMATGAFIFVERSAFASVNGFDERYFTAEDCYLTKTLRKKGRFVILRETVMTSGRKMRAYTPWQLANVFGRILLRGEAACQTRDGLEFWYQRKDEPVVVTEAGAAGGFPLPAEARA